MMTSEEDGLSPCVANTVYMHHRQDETGQLPSPVSPSGENDPSRGWLK